MMHVGARNTLADAGRRNAEVLHAMGMAPRMGKIWGGRQHQISREPAADLGCRGRARRDLEGPALHAAIRRARTWRLSGDPAAGDGRHHHRKLDHRRARACAGRAGDRQLAAVSWRRARAGSVCRNFSSATEKGLEPMALPAPKGSLVGGERHRDSAGRAAGGRAGRNLRAQGGSGSRHHRTERVGQVVARAADRRRLAAGARQGAARRRRAGSMVAGRARPAHRLPAAGRRAVRRNGRAEHRALRAGRAVRGGHRGKPGGRRARHDRAAAGRLRHADRRGRRGALRRPAPAHRACARALSRPVPRRARRAQLQPRLRWRQSADAGDHARAGARRRSSIVVAHRPSALAGVDQVLAMVNGRAHALGPRDEVLAKLFGPPQTGAACRRQLPAAAAAAGGAVCGWSARPEEPAS